MNIFSLDNHYLVGGQGDRIAEVMAKEALSEKRLFRVGISEIPACGTNPEILSLHGLDQDGLVKAIAHLSSNKNRKA